MFLVSLLYIPKSIKIGVLFGNNKEQNQRPMTLLLMDLSWTNVYVYVKNMYVCVCVFINIFLLSFTMFTLISCLVIYLLKQFVNCHRGMTKTTNGIYFNFLLFSCMYYVFCLFSFCFCFFFIIIIIRFCSSPTTFIYLRICKFVYEFFSVCFYILLF